MRFLPQIRSVLNESNNKFIGVNKPHGRVTVEPAWQLNMTGEVYGKLDKGPYRYWAYEDGSQVELEVPNVESIDISRSLDQEAATCTIVMHNQFHDDNDQTPPNLQQVGNPGYYSFGYGSAPDKADEWGHVEHAWSNILVPNALLRTFQGYGGYVESNGELIPKDIDTAVTDGDLVITGVWLIDTVSLGTSGKIRLQCRDMGKLLIEQLIYPPLIPDRYYPPKWYRYDYETVPGTPGDDGVPDEEPLILGEAQLRYEDSSVERWLGANSSVGGLAPRAFTHNETEVSFGHGWFYWNDGTYAKDWWQAECETEINEIYISPAGAPPNGDYFTWISVMENGVWQGADTIPYDGDDIGNNIQIHHSDKPSLETGIEFVKSTAVEVSGSVNENVENGTWIKLDRVYKAERIRVTFASTWESPWGPNPYRSGVASIRAQLENIDVVTNEPTVATEDETIQIDGNIKDWMDPIREMLLWSGFLLYEGADPGDDPGVFGILENSGTYPLENLAEDLFEKKTIMDSIISIKEVLGYIFFINEEGGVQLTSPNWWSPGNTVNGDTRLNYAHEITDESVMTDYTANFTDASVRSEVIIGSSLSDEVSGQTQHVSFDPTAVQAPGSPDFIRGMVKPAVWINDVWTDENEQKLMAALISLHIMFNTRQGQVTIVANPEIQIDDQVRITERLSSESFLHYVRSIDSNMNLETGEWTMTIGTNWLGDQEAWAFDRNELLALYTRQNVNPTSNYENGRDAWRSFQDNRAQDLRIVTVETAPAITHGVGGVWTGLVIGPADPGGGLLPSSVIDSDTVAFFQSVGDTGTIAFDYAFSTGTLPDGYDIYIFTNEMEDSDIATIGSLANLNKRVIHARPDSWDVSEISTQATANSNNSSTIDAQANAEFTIPGSPGVVAFGSSTVTTASEASGNLPAGLVSVGEAPVGGDVVVGAIPVGTTYQDANASTVKHVMWGTDFSDADALHTNVYTAMSSAILWLREI